MARIIPLWNFCIHFRLPYNAKTFEVIIAHPIHFIPFWNLYLRRACYFRKNKNIYIGQQDLVYLFLRRAINII